MPLPYPTTAARQKVFANVQALQADGYTRGAAIAECFNAARKEYFRRYPAGALPEWLTYDANYRLARYYTDSGAFIKQNPLPARGAKIKRAARLFRSFTGDAHERAVTVDNPGAGFDVGIILGHALGLDLETRDGVPVGHLKIDLDAPPALVVSFDGKRAAFIDGDFMPLHRQPDPLDGFVVSRIMYQTVRDGVAEKYQHPFARNARPLLKLIDGRTAKMSGGSFRFTERGFVDFAR